MHDTRDKPSNQSLPEALDIMCVLDEIIDALEKETSSGFPGKLLKEVPFVADSFSPEYSVSRLCRLRGDLAR